jgi:hypothetical protein
MATTGTTTAVPNLTEVGTAARRGVAVILAGAAVFFAALVGLARFRDFLAGSEDTTLPDDALRAARLEVLADDRGQVLAGFILVGVGELLLGVGMWILLTAVARAESGWRAVVTSASAWSCLAGGALSLLLQVWPPMWTGEDTGIAAIGFSGITAVGLPIAFALIGLGFLGASAAILTSGTWPRWTGAVLAVTGVLPFITNLPLFFQVGGVIAGIGLGISARRARRGHQATPVT